MRSFHWTAFSEDSLVKRSTLIGHISKPLALLWRKCQSVYWVLNLLIVLTLYARKPRVKSQWPKIKSKDRSSKHLKISLQWTFHFAHCYLHEMGLFLLFFMGMLIPYIIHLDKQLIMLFINITYTLNFDNQSLKYTSLCLNCKIWEFDNCCLTKIVSR